MKKLFIGLLFCVNASAQEMRYLVKYFYTDNGTKGEVVNSVRILQFKTVDGPWTDVPSFDDTTTRDALEKGKRLPITVKALKK